MYFLQSMFEHRSISLFHDFGLNNDFVIWADAKISIIESGMVDLAERQSVTHQGFPHFFTIRDDMRRIQQIGVMQSADRAPLLVGLQDPIPERSLMHSLADKASSIAPARLFIAVVSLVLQLRRFIGRNGELKTARVVADYIYRPNRQISAWDCRKEVSERDSIVHRIPQAPVLVEIWVVSPVPSQ